MGPSQGRKTWPFATHLCMARGEGGKLRNYQFSIHVIFVLYILKKGILPCSLFQVYSGPGVSYYWRSETFHHYDFVSINAGLYKDNILEDIQAQNQPYIII